MAATSFYPFPTLTTQRLILRQPRTEDAADLFLLRSDPEVMRYIPRPLAQSVEDVVSLIQMINDFTQKGERINWAMEWKETGEVIGLLGYVNIKPEHQRAEVGYSLARTWHRKGIMREALREVVRYGFEEMNMHSIEAVLDEENTPSARLLEDAGFVQEARFREDFLWQGIFRNSLHYGLLRTEWSKH
jgi:ribosomal-protein-alanine N-acetyltransferase